jgi:hypothetical protein
VSIHKSSTLSAVAACIFSCIATTASAQAYVNQTSSGETNAYVTQAPPTARQVEIPAGPARRTPSVGGKRPATGIRTAKNPFPSVGQGSAAIVKIEAEVDTWPTVGRGVVNR